MNTVLDRIISVTELRRNFGAITENLPRMESIILTKGGEPFAILSAVPKEKKKILEKTKGIWKKSPLDKDDVWKKVFERRSRKAPVIL